MQSVRDIQTALLSHGFSPGLIDGVMGPRTEAAIVAFKKRHGLLARPYIGPLTRALLFGKNEPDKTDLPWLNEVAKYMHMHEVTHFAKLSAWLRSDGKTLGDPRKLPWCGDLVETAIKLTLRDEPFPGRLGINPYLARNWLEFGEVTGPSYGAVVVFWRGTRDGLSGHVGFAVGYDPVRKNIRCRGGNQSNAVNDAWLSEDRLLGFRWPKTYNAAPEPLPNMNSAGAVLSTNEA